jgi:hypothetical protein
MAGAISAGRQRAAAHGTSSATPWRLRAPGGGHDTVLVWCSHEAPHCANAARPLSNQMIESMRGQRADLRQRMESSSRHIAGDKGALSFCGGDILQSDGGAALDVTRFLRRTNFSPLLRSNHSVMRSGEVC